jgi:hypothetical protein
MGIFKKTKPKADAPSTQIPQQEPDPWYSKLLKRPHAESETFNARSFPFDELYPRWKGPEFNADIMNAGSGVIFAKTHHVKGKAEKHRDNFKDFDFAFCLEWTDRTVDGVKYRDRCYNEFTVKSQGCIEHRKVQYKEGCNQVFERMI